MKKLAAIAALAVMGIAGASAAVLVSSSSASDPFVDCGQARSEALLATRITGSSKSYRTDNPTEYVKVRAYLDGGVRPTGVTTHMGLHLMYGEDVCRSLAPVTTTTTTTTTTTPPPPTANFFMSPSGSDSNPCTQGAPCRSFGRAFGVASAGSVIQLAGGQYAGEGLGGTKGTADVIFRAAVGQVPWVNTRMTLNDLDHVIFDGIKWRTTQPCSDSDFSGCYTLFFDACNDDVTITNSPDSSSFTFSEGNTDIHITNSDWGNYGPPYGFDSSTNVNHRSCNGAPAQNTNGLYIEDNHFHDVYWGLTDYQGAHPDCLQFDGGATNVFIRRNHFERCANSFIMFTPDLGNATSFGLFNFTFEHNIFEQLGRGVSGVGTYFGIQILCNPDPPIERAGNVVFRYNVYDPKNPSIIEGYPDSPIRVQCDSAAGYAEPQVYGNIFSKAPDSNECQSENAVWSYNVFEIGTCGSNATQIADVGFVDRAADDYHLTANSGAINKGDPVRFPPTDYFGNPRKLGSAADAGIHEKS